jgi:hypothetical protein
MTNQVATKQTTDVAQPMPDRADAQGSNALMQIIERAANSPDFDPDKLEKLLDVKERWEREEARKAFVRALNAFKAEPPTITKNKHVGYESKGGRTEYDHATLDHICNQIAPALAEHGLSHRWKVEQGQQGISVTCVLTHEAGHSEEVTLTAAADQSGGKNSIQAVGSTQTYLQRYTLLAATGLAAADQDDDGRGADEAQKPIRSDQKQELVDLIKETGADTRKFCQYLGVESLDEIPVSKFDRAKAALERKRGQ